MSHDETQSSASNLVKRLKEAGRHREADEVAATYGVSDSDESCSGGSDYESDCTGSDGDED